MVVVVVVAGVLIAKLITALSGRLIAVPSGSGSTSGSNSHW